MDLEPAVKDVLESWGFSVEKIPESSRTGEKTPDFKVRDRAVEYILELKTRRDDPEREVARTRTLTCGELFEEHMPLVRRNTIAGIIRDACQQLENHEDRTPFRVVWLAATDSAQDAKMRQFEAALYGLTQMFDWDGDSFHRPCYFFRNSEFFRHRLVLDAAIVSSLSTAKLCLNPFSSRASAFRSTEMVARFGTAVRDPLTEEAAGEAYFVDCDLDRKDEEAVMAYLRTKYGRPKLCNIDLGYHAATVSVANDA